MSKKRGLSVDDKRAAILKIYHERKEPLNLKEIENYGSKVGVVQQTIKDINQSLVDDSLLLTDKIGSANFYWSFPSKNILDKEIEKQRLLSILDKSKNSKEVILASIEEERKKRSKPGRDEKVIVYF